MTTGRTTAGWLRTALLMLGCGWIYREVVSFGFVSFDDDYNLVFNPHLGPLSWERAAWAWGDFEYMRRYLPLGWLGFMGVFSFSGLNPAGYHAAALVLHVGNTLLLASLLDIFVRRYRPDVAVVWRQVAVGVATAFWAWHPLRVESVAWASGLLYAQAICALWLALRLHAGGEGRVRRALAWGCYVASLLTYPIALGAWPLFVFVDGSSHGWRDAWRKNWGYAGAAFAALAVAVVTQARAHDVFGGVPAAAEFPLAQRALQALYVGSHYLWRAVWPVNLTPMDPVLCQLAEPTWRVWGGAMATVAVAGVAWWSRRRARLLALLIVAYAAALVPFLGLTENPHFPSDRYSFLAHAILAVGLVAWLVRLPAPRARTMALVAALALLGGAAALSRQQTEIWRDETTLWRHFEPRLADELPPFATQRLALWHARAGRTTEALAVVDERLARQPNAAAFHALRAYVVKLDRDGQDLARALGLSAPPPPAAILHRDIAVTCTRRGDLAAAAWHLREVGRLAPDYLAAVTRAGARPSAR